MRRVIPDHQLNGRVCVRAAFRQRASNRKIWNIKQLIVPVDFSEGSEKAIDCAVSLAKQTGATIRLVHVVEPRRLFNGGSGIYAMYDRNIITGAHQMLAELATDRVQPSIRSECEVPIGRPAHEICKIARKYSNCLIVIATHSFTGLKRLVFGSTASLVVRQAPCAVLVVPTRGKREDFKALHPTNILLPIDFSKDTSCALNCAVPLAKPIGANLQLLHVVPGMCINSFAQGLLLEADLKKAARKTLDELISLLKTKGLTVNTVLKQGDTGRQIIRTANQLKSDLIIMTTHRRNHTFRGGITENVLRHSRYPVLVCRPEGVKPKKPALATGRLKTQRRFAQNRAKIGIELKQANPNGLSHPRFQQT